MFKGFFYLVISGFLLISTFVMQTKKSIAYLPLGDSYTIGTGAKQEEAWPVLLAKHLTSEGLPCTLLENPARNGYSTQDLIDEELLLIKKLKPDFVTLLIGVNDWVRGVPKASFTKNLVYILETLQKELPDKSQVLLVTIPDFGVTPTGKTYSAGRNISDGIREFNEVIKAEAGKRNLKVVDIFEISQKMGSDPSLVARDGLHPSAKEYVEWEKLIFIAARNVLK